MSKRHKRSRDERRRGVLLGLSGLALVAIGLFCLSLALGAVVVGSIFINEAGIAPATSGPQPAPVDEAQATVTLLPTSTKRPPLATTSPPTDTPVRIVTSTPIPVTPTPSPTSRPATATSPPSTEAAPSPTARSTPATSAIRATFLADARNTEDDLMTIKVWFDRLAGGERITCDTVYAHAIHRPSSRAPEQDPSLAQTWNEYQAAITDGQSCLQWLVDFCDAGGGTIDETTFWDRRDLSSSALSRCEHVVRTLEGR